MVGSADSTHPTRIAALRGSVRTAPPAEPGACGTLALQPNTAPRTPRHRGLSRKHLTRSLRPRSDLAPSGSSSGPGTSLRRSTATLLRSVGTRLLGAETRTLHR